MIAILFSESRNVKSISILPVRLGEIEPLNVINPKCQSAGQSIHKQSLENSPRCRPKMPDHLNIVTAQIVGHFVTSVLYGLYLYTFFRCLYVLTRSRSGWKGYSNIHWGLVVVTLALFVNGTLNISLGVLRQIQQFSLHRRRVAWVNSVKVVEF